MSLNTNSLTADSGGSSSLSALKYLNPGQTVYNKDSNDAFFEKAGSSSNIKKNLSSLNVSNTVNNDIASSLADYKAKLVGDNSGKTASETANAVSVSSDLNKAVSSNDYSSVLNYLQNIADSNTAKSIELANSQNKWQEEQNAKAMEFNKTEAQLNREWQEYMSNTAHQREVQDLIAAGLNPVLSATGGNGASVTSGATASGVTSSGAKGDVDTSVSSALGSFLTALLNSATAITTAGISSAATLSAAEKTSSATKYGSTATSVSSLLGSVLRLASKFIK